MKSNKLIFCALGALLAVFAAATAIIVFKTEIFDFFAELKEKFEDKRACFHSDFADYDDV